MNTLDFIAKSIATELKSIATSDPNRIINANQYYKVRKLVQKELNPPQQALNSLTRRFLRQYCALTIASSKDYNKLCNSNLHVNPTPSDILRWIDSRLIRAGLDASF